MMSPPNSCQHDATQCAQQMLVDILFGTPIARLGEDAGLGMQTETLHLLTALLDGGQCWRTA